MTNDRKAIPSGTLVEEQSGSDGKERLESWFLISDNWSLITSFSAIAEILGVFAGVAKIIVDKNGGLAGKLEAFAAFVASDEIVQADHEGTGSGELAAVFFAGAAGEFLFLA
jgi:hypothetical protein